MGQSAEELSEEEYIPVPRKVRHHQVRKERDNMTPFQENLVWAMAETSSPSFLRKKVFQALSDQQWEDTL